jgi:hypothetical protein
MDRDIVVSTYVVRMRDKGLGIYLRMPNHGRVFPEISEIRQWQATGVQFNQVPLDFCMWHHCKTAGYRTESESLLFI